jgi:tricorn protease
MHRGLRGSSQTHLRAVTSTSFLLCLFAATLVAARPALAQDNIVPHGGMMRYPDVSKTHVVFAYANDLWIVSRDGGQAVPLASPPGSEGFPKFSADGKTIAFLGNYEGNHDIYTISIDGGIPHRVTHHPSSELLNDWTPDGRLLFSMAGLAGQGRQTQLFFVNQEGGMPEKLPVPYGAAGAISPDGTWLAYTPHNHDFRTWKRYRGGLASDIWLFNLKDNTSKRATDWEGTDSLPMWHGEKMYYLSDAGDEHRLNIWVYDLDSGNREQITRFSEYDVKFPSMGPGANGQGEIVFQNGSALYLLDVRNRSSKQLNVRIPGARPTIRPKSVDASSFIDWWHISPTGKRAVVSARGDVWTLPAKDGSPRNLTRTDSSAERSPVWSPDGRWIAYFSDETGEYELYITQSDGKGETSQITKDSETFYTRLSWSPDSKHIVFGDKAGKTWLHTRAADEQPGTTTLIDQDPWNVPSDMSFSHDSRWIAFSRSDEEAHTRSIYVYDIEAGELHQLTSGFFDDSSPAFDRKGDFLYFATSRTFSPTYSDVDTTYIYDRSQVLVAAPLRKDVKSPYIPKSDEEEWKDDEKKDDDEAKNGEDKDDESGEADEADDADENGDNGNDDDDDNDNGNGDDESKEPAPDDGISGTWEGSVSHPEMPPGITFVMQLTLASDGATLSGTITAAMGSASFNGTYDKASGAISGSIRLDSGPEGTFSGTITGGGLKMSVTVEGSVAELTGTRTAAAREDAEDGDKEDDKPAERVEIDIEDFETRLMELAVPRGNFRNLACNDSNQLLYVRSGVDSPGSIMLFDINDDKKEEKTVAAGAGSFEMSGNGKKILVVRGSGAAIQNASAGGTPENVPTSGMTMRIDPRTEWKQLLVEAWRLQRDFLYVDNMHGVDWPKVKEQYLAMLDDCVTREDVGFVISEMIAELNIGHAYYFGGDVESAPSVSVGLLGVDFELDDEDDVFRIVKIVQGAEWDVDARNPLSEPGLDVKEGDYLLAVNGVEVDASKDPWAAFIGLAGRTVTITVSDTPELDDEAREVIIKPIGSEGNLRYRDWIEKNRAYVEEKTDGKVGYIHVPDTGVNGQNNLYRQFFGQSHKQALIIDERWNGGGQIPTRFIELLNRPITNYWARRDGKDWPWPPDAHQGPKCMLINGPSGSGGDMFPWLFRQSNLGKLIGTRTWGGLVGISGNPRLIDGAVVTVPTFGFYEKDGTWGVEGHGVDPDIEVLDDPALMFDGGDPQLDRAIELMLEEIEANPYTPPQRPEPPVRTGIGVTEEDK